MEFIRVKFEGEPNFDFMKAYLGAIAYLSSSETLHLILSLIKTHVFSSSGIKKSKTS